MTRLTKSMRSRGGLVAMFALLTLPGAALAQPPGGPGGPGGPPPGGFGGPGGPGGPGRQPFGGPRGGQMSALNVPVSALAATLSLTATQKDKIAKIQKQFQQDRNAMMPARPEPGSPPPDPETMRASFDAIAGLERKASQQANAVLTDDQKKALPAALKDIQALRLAGIPAEVLSDLKLTSDQRKQITAGVQKAQDAMRQKMDDARQSGDFESARAAMSQSRQSMHAKAMAVLSEDQQTIVTDYLKDHPQREQGPGFGGPGGPGGPGGFGPPPGGFGGPDGPGGPPPGGFGGPDGPGGPPPGGPGDGPGGPPPPDGQ